MDGLVQRIWRVATWLRDHLDELHETATLAEVAGGLIGHFRGHTLDFVDFDEKNARYSPFEERRTRSRNVISRRDRTYKLRFPAGAGYGKVG